MEVKMCEIATALADSILCCGVPLDDGSAASKSSSYYGKGYQAGARAALKSLADRIFETRTMNPDLRDALAGKVAVVLRCSDIAPNMPVVIDKIGVMTGSVRDQDVSRKAMMTLFSIYTSTVEAGSLLRLSPAL